MLKQLNRIVFMTILLFSVTHGQGSRYFADLGNLTWSAFECSALSQYLGDTTEVERLFRIGYKSGKAFLKAVNDKKINEVDLNSTVPINLRWILLGPNIDFVMGRIHTLATQMTVEGISKTDGKYNSDKEQQALAKAKIEECGCKSMK